MKTKTKKTITVLLSLIMITAGLSSFAQQGHGFGPGGNGDCPFLDLTNEQADQIKELRLAHYKEVEPLRAQMSELAVKHRNLMRAESVDIKAINASIDKKTELMNKLMKKQVEFRTEFRNLLTDEQKIRLDKTGRRFGMKQGMRKSRRQGMGNYGRRGRNSYSGGFKHW